MGTQIEATFRSRGSHHPAGCPRHQARIVAGSMPRRRPIADSRYDGNTQSSAPRACTDPAWIASVPQKIAYVPIRPWRW